MKKLTRILALIMAVVMVAAVFTGCSKGSKDTDSSAPSSIREAPDQERDLMEGSGDEAETLGFPQRELKNKDVTVFIPYDPKDIQKNIDAFKERYGANVIIEQCQWDQRFTRLATLIQSGDAPDVVSVVYSDMPTMAVKGLLQPIDGLTDLNNKVYDQTSNDGAYTFNGKHYALTAIGVPYGIYYNDTMFKRAGVKTPIEYYNEGTWNWENFRKTALAMSEDTDNDGINDIFGFATWKDDIFAIANGADLIKMENGSPVLNINDPRVTEGLQFFQDMFYTDHSIQIAHWEWKEGFANKKVAMVFEGWTYQTELLYEQSFDDDIGVVPFPMGPSAQGEQVNYTANTGWGLCKDAANVEGGVAFIEEYLTNTAKRVLDGTAYSHLTDEQFEMAKIMVGQKSILPYSSGYGDFLTVFNDITDQLRDGKAVGTILQRFAPELQNEINETLGFEE